MESITKQAENARKYERIFECGVRCWPGIRTGTMKQILSKARIHDVEDGVW